MADIIGISRQGYNTYESGKIKAPRKLEELAKFFNVSTDYLLGKDTEPVADPKGYYNDPSVGERVAALQENPKLRILMDASRDLSNEDIDYVVKMVETLRKAHGMD
jgi:transcriptional regulator with XRE-family HTH domain